ncbi:hypothetical protein COLO4_05366 [Corchorus olitorius]|uniref:Inorganic polyphosphate/ATP-NAD kinase n=1 Tax=Corchorus olitorius TaxID=93759 RepID=A0A1R3KR58_9ROSI|nr:hypothetical protein COLO4_05366 [Corchorus olitorius]
MSPSKLDSSASLGHGDASISCSKPENGFVDSVSFIHSEKAVEELLQQTPVDGMDEHLIEFSEALRTVAKALRRAAEGKASAQAEAAEWKRRYELERTRNIQMERKARIAERSSAEENGDFDCGRVENPDNQLIQQNELDEHSEKCCMKHGICSHEVLRDRVSDSNCNKDHSKMMRKASFKLSWWCKGENGDQHKHDIVSFEKGNITTAERSSRQAASMFKGPVPPIVPFSLGSLGFMTPFHSEHYKEYLDSILRGPISITLRHRLLCRVVRDAAKNEYETEEPILVLNEVTIDRGISSYLTNLECYCDNSFVTCVQGDGLILSTTSGSTAYSLAAGGSMVHPQVPGILFTPICPHSLSFRPLILPEHVTVRIVVPFNSRSPAWASFDGKDRKQLAAGDALLCSMAPWPVPTACQVDSTNDFLRSIHEGLHWNLRKTQSFDGPRDV